MEPIPETRWHEEVSGGEPDRTLNIGTTAEGDQSVGIWISASEDRRLGFVLTTEQFGELITDGMRRLVRMRGRSAAFAAAAGVDPGASSRETIEVLIERSSLGTPAAKAARASVPREVAERIVRRAESVDTPAAGATTPGTGDEPHHGPASRPEPVRLLYVNPTGPTTVTPVHDELYEAMRAALAVGTPGRRYRGFHTCACGARSANYDVQLPDGAWTNTLAPHYLAWHRHEIPTDKLERVARHLGVDLP